MLVPIGPHQGQPPLPLGRLFTLIGSAPSARLYLASKQVSRCHAVVINADTGLFVRDLASRAELRVNGRAVKEADLRDGDVLDVGPFSFRFTDATDRRARPPALPVPQAFLETDGLDEALPLEARTTLIGRRESADVSLTENAASSAHALLFVAEGKHLLRDLNSRTGTFVNGVKVHEHVLSPGDVLRIGETTFRYVRRAGGKREETRAAAVAPAPAAPAPPIEAPVPEAVEATVEEPIAVEPEPAAEQASEAAKDEFDFAPIEVVSEIEPGAVTAPRHADVTPERIPEPEPVGLIEVSETSREAEQEPAEQLADADDHAADPIPLAGVEADAPNDDTRIAASVRPAAAATDSREVPEPIELTAPEPEPRVEERAPAPPPAPPPPARPVTASRPAPPAAAKQERAPARRPGKTPPPPARPPEKQKPAAPGQPTAQKQWNKPPAPVKGGPPSGAARQPRPQSPFDVLGDADELEPLPDLEPEPSAPPPAAGSAPDAAGRST
jgi:pSer/pThr/pTyr-binding forkhead associated (FHA) protein